MPIRSSFPIELPQKFLIKIQELSIFPEDISEKYTRGSGPGGQKINTTSNTVVLKHTPSGIVIKCQKHRERKRNRISAYKLLINKIEDLKKGEKSERAQKIYKLRKQKQRRSKKAKEKILKLKKMRGEIKELRKKF